MCPPLISRPQKSLNPRRTDGRTDGRTNGHLFFFTHQRKGASRKKLFNQGDRIFLTYQNEIISPRNVQKWCLSWSNSFWASKYDHTNYKKSAKIAKYQDFQDLRPQNGVCPALYHPQSPRYRSSTHITRCGIHQTSLWHDKKKVSKKMYDFFLKSGLKEASKTVYPLPDMVFLRTGYLTSSWTKCACGAITWVDLKYKASPPTFSNEL